MTASRPLYRVVADEIRGQIASGRYRVGDQLPTELDLCRQRNISRHTAREALRVLIEAGLITRRRGSGTTVAATAGPPRFVQPLGDVDDLLKYAADARLQVTGIDDLLADKDMDPSLRLVAGHRYRVILGLRRTQNTVPPLASTMIYIAAANCPPEDKIIRWPRALSELIELETGLRIARIEQQISGTLARESDATSLDIAPGSAMLRTVRLYHDMRGQVVMSSDSRHPADRFVYRMSVSRHADPD